MLLLRTERLTEGPESMHELKFDRYRVLSMKSGAKVHLRSRNDNDIANADKIKEKYGDLPAAWRVRNLAWNRWKGTT